MHLQSKHGPCSLQKTVGIITVNWTPKSQNVGGQKPSGYIHITC